MGQGSLRSRVGSGCWGNGAENVHLITLGAMIPRKRRIFKPFHLMVTKVAHGKWTKLKGMKTSISFDVGGHNKHASHYLIYKLGKQPGGREISCFPLTNSVCRQRHRVTLLLASSLSHQHQLRHITIPVLALAHCLPSCKITLVFWPTKPIFSYSLDLLSSLPMEKWKHPRNWC